MGYIANLNNSCQLLTSLCKGVNIPESWLRQKLYSFYQRMFSAKIDEIWTSNSLKVVKVFSLCHTCIYLPLEKDVNLNKFKQIRISFTQGDLYQVCLELGQWLLRKKMNVVNIFSLCCYLPMKSAYVALYSEQTSILFKTESFVPSLANGPVHLDEIL